MADSSPHNRRTDSVALEAMIASSSASLRDGAVHVWLADAPARLPRAWRRRARALLDEEESARLRRFRFPRDRRTYLVSHALRRTVLASLVASRPDALAFGIGPHGKPMWAAGAPLRHNLSHTNDMAALAVAADAEVGVDIERIDRVDRPLELARRFFSSEEAAAVARAPAAEHAARFARIWTLKEAFVKAAGSGLTEPLSGFTFTLRDGAAPDLRIDDPRWGAPEGWRVQTFTPSPAHAGAVALRLPPDASAPHTTTRRAGAVDSTPLRLPRLRVCREGENLFRTTA